MTNLLDRKKLEAWLERKIYVLKCCDTRNDFDEAQKWQKVLDALNHFTVEEREWVRIEDCDWPDSQPVWCLYPEADIGGEYRGGPTKLGWARRKGEGPTHVAIADTPPPLPREDMADAMNRQIKFRVWDHDREKMTPLEKMFGDVKFTHLAYASTGLVGGKGNVSFMQFTGLHDADGNEIYEGDVVRYDDSPNSGELWFVEWYGGDASFIVREPTSGASEGLVDIHRGRVIGNIYDNPDLLID